MSFTRWSQTNSEAKKTLSPDLGLRHWNELTQNEKAKIWLFFVNKGWFKEDSEYVPRAIYSLNEHYKTKCYGVHLQSHGGLHFLKGGVPFVERCCEKVAHMDLQHIISSELEDVVYETISLYLEALEIVERGDQERILRFKNLFNDISNQFGLNVLLGPNSFVPRQEEKIVNDIYEPTLKILAEEKWSPVSRDLGDAFSDYIKATPEGYSSSITHAISALQAFLQILVKENIGKGGIAELIKKGQQKDLIPNDPFSSTIFKNIESILMQERQAKGDAHPKKEYANEKTAKLTLNLIMVFIQHCLQ